MSISSDIPDELEIVQALTSFVSNELCFGQSDQTEINASSKLEAVGVDSFGLLELLIYIEREFKVKIAVQDLSNTTNLSIAGLANKVFKALVCQ
jgi:acyl carrier protein